MWSGATFGDILDEKLDARFHAGQPGADADSYFVRPSAPPPPHSSPSFAFADVAPSQACTAYAHHDALAGVVGGRPARQPRALSQGQRAALLCLQDAVASALDETFSDADLRSAFRALARRFHPDCHPGASESERFGLARTFARITDAYRTLAVLMAN